MKTNTSVFSVLGLFALIATALLLAGAGPNIRVQSEHAQRQGLVIIKQVQAKT